MALASARVLLFQGRDRRWYFKRQARNGRITAVSEGYVRRSACETAARRNFPGHEVVNVTETWKRIRRRVKR